MNSRLITIYSDRQTQVPKLTNDEKGDILALKDLLGSQYILLQANDSLQIMHYVGFIARGKTRLQILPKIYADHGKISAEEEKSESVLLLLRLLSYSGYLGYKEIPDPQSIESCDNDLFEIFIGIFVNRFLDVFIRNLHRSYEVYEENKQFIKGKILFHETILKNSLRKDRHYIRYDEFTINTLLNRIFKTVLLRLLSQTVLSENKKKLNLALNHLEEVEPIDLYRGIFDKVIFNRMNIIYQPILLMAKLLYTNRQPGFSGGDENTFTFLVPLNKLFEYYAYKLIDNYSQKSAFRVRYQGPEKYLALHKGERHFPLKPDITIFHHNEILYIIDAKFKNPFDGLEHIDLKSPDIYQIVTYAVCYQCENVFLLYPRFKGQLMRDTELANYNMQTKTGSINLRILQIDIMQTDNDKTQKQLVESIFSVNNCEAVQQSASENLMESLSRS
jgi:5-methylcytosine-specific restriction enzyme subunit McrC